MLRKTFEKGGMVAMLRFLQQLTRRLRGRSLTKAKLWLALLSLVFLPLFVSAEPACEAQKIRERYGVEIVLVGQSWSETSLGAVDDALSRLPPHVVSQLGSRFNGSLYILCNTESRTLSGTSVFSHGANFYSNSDGRNELVLYPDQSTPTVLHELAHAYQLRLVPAGKYALVFRDEKMKDFMQATGWRLLSSDAQVETALDQTQLSFAYDGPTVWHFMSNNDPLEDYANSFALFFYDLERLRQLSPVRYDWILEHVASE
ncbi:MAG: hypothetical protein A2172_01220 [Candidatus Woykebacteria bacterium RBG_13_40_15]|uniref:Uncharacterized protein n=1 Tax=Candidatus Woykebacteria bacterium RBG_13_40_15 TaxID=1802593 RepID=A0A1G1W8Z0_9BACT|nr:MAG: hypothetical protein A2172_01220 [Candidatus Woykebacteria bacterium RBG_13_40_15]